LIHVENHNSMLRRTHPVLALGWLVYCLAAVAFAQTAADPSNLSASARFLVAARNADAAAMKRELAAGAVVDARNRLGESALIIVLKKDRADLAGLLLDAGANVNQAAVNGITPLMAASYAGHEAIVKRLLAQGADPRPADRLNKTAMVYAAGEGRTAIVQMLVASGIGPDEVYANDLTALMWAAGYGRTATVKALLDAGADRTRRDNRGKTAADIAREQGFSETAALLQR
jgi:ankyrin repeat protein